MKRAFVLLAALILALGTGACQTRNTTGSTSSSWGGSSNPSTDTDAGARGGTDRGTLGNQDGSAGGGGTSRDR